MGPKSCITNADEAAAEVSAIDDGTEPVNTLALLAICDTAQPGTAANCAAPCSSFFATAIQ